eukprot:gene51154-69623_t
MAITTIPTIPTTPVTPEGHARERPTGDPAVDHLNGSDASEIDRRRPAAAHARLAGRQARVVDGHEGPGGFGLIQDPCERRRTRAAQLEVQRRGHADDVGMALKRGDLPTRDQQQPHYDRRLLRPGRART